MRWEELTAPEFAAAVRETGVCVVALGVIERHSDHLPLGTDYLVGHKIACLAAEKEPAVVFPPFYFGQIYEARCFPGTLTLKPTLLLEVLQGVLDEIGRNGFRKIVLYNAHGGNSYLLGFLAQSALWEEKPYSLYIPLRRMTPEGEKEWEAIRDTSFGGHACEWETSLVLGTYPHLVKMERVPEAPGVPLKRMEHLPPTLTGIWWYSDYPEHYAGDARSASVGKGELLVRLESDYLAQYIAAVKADQVVPALEREFFARVKQVSGA
ncbi:MAG: creatininase family protein [Anaerolineae bacterium]|nr:creatininase family protein [Anaerolineae bacterium]